MAPLNFIAFRLSCTAVKMKQIMKEAQRASSKKKHFLTLLPPQRPLQQRGPLLPSTQALYRAC